MMERRHGIYNGMFGLGPNITGYPGGYPNGYLELLQRLRLWPRDRLHLCSGSVHDGITVDVKSEVRPTVCCDLRGGVPFRDNSFDAVYIDPPYAEEKASQLYAVPLLSVPKLLTEAARVVRPSGYVVLLDLRVWPPPDILDWYALCAIYVANRGPKPLRALQVWRKRGTPLEWFGGDG